MKKNNFKNIIVGTGFSAAISKLIIGKDSLVIGNYDHKIFLNNKDFFRRENIECNKLFSKKVFSFGSLNFTLFKGVFHDHFGIGGNSNIWGGHINLKKFSSKKLYSFERKGINFQKLDFKTTGTKTNNLKIKQMQNKKNKILNIDDFNIKIKNGFIHYFYSKNGSIFLGIQYPHKKKINEIKVKRIFLCTGAIQLLDLLYRSKLLKDGDLIQFSEFEHKFILKFTFSKFEKNCTTIRYHISRSIGHFLGFQYFSNFLKLLKFLPICIDQNFYKKKKKIKLILKNNTLEEYNFNKNSYSKFGDSIHYCDLKINGIKINNFLKKVNTNIHGFGMPFVNQIDPGPISNDIMLDILKKLNILGLNENK